VAVSTQKIADISFVGNSYVSSPIDVSAYKQLRIVVRPAFFGDLTAALYTIFGPNDLFDVARSETPSLSEASPERRSTIFPVRPSGSRSLLREVRAEESSSTVAPTRKKSPGLPPGTLPGAV
jgi:hypothetical protein